MSISVSVAIPTKGRGQELIETLKSLTVQTVLPFEITVVDQNQPPIKEVVDFISQNKIIRHFYNFEQGLVKNYNFCLKVAKGDVILFLDDDITADQKLIENIIKAFSSNPQLALIAGQVKNKVGDLDPARIKKVGIYNPWTNRVYANFNAEGKIREVMFAQGAQMAFRRKTLEAINGFDEGFSGTGYFFETDGALRLIKQGYKAEFHPECKIIHHMAPRGGARMNKIDQTYYFVKNGIRLNRRHAKTYQWPVFYIWLLAYIFAKSMYNLSPKLLLKSLKAILDGLYLRPL